MSRVNKLWHAVVLTRASPRIFLVGKTHHYSPTLLNHYCEVHSALTSKDMFDNPTLNVASILILLLYCHNSVPWVFLSQVTQHCTKLVSYHHNFTVDNRCSQHHHIDRQKHKQIYKNMVHWKKWRNTKNTWTIITPWVKAVIFIKGMCHK